MTISQLIAKLVALQEAHGDITVASHTPDGPEVVADAGLAVTGVVSPHQYFAGEWWGPTPFIIITHE
jgi:hypothetical protein